MTASEVLSSKELPKKLRKSNTDFMQFVKLDQECVTMNRGRGETEEAQDTLVTSL